MKQTIYLLLCGVIGCTTNIYDDSEGTPFDPNRPGDPGDKEVEPYTGNDQYVLDAQSQMYTGYDMHDKVIRRACSGIDGVCHNQKEYPDMRTAGTFLSTINAPCNLNAKTFATVYNRCELVGDKIEFEDVEGGAIEIAYIDWRQGEPSSENPDADDNGLHVYLRNAIPLELGSRNRTANFRRRLNNNGSVSEVVFQRYRGRWWVISPTHLMLEVPNRSATDIENIVAAGIHQGDHNRDGIYGADAANLVPLINPTKPDESYLVARLTGTMQGENIPGTRMPLANIPPTIPEMLALVCFIEGLPTDDTPVSMEWPIDYKNCSYSANPEALTLTGTTGTTWSGRVWPILQSNCGSCHGGQAPSADLDLLSATAYDNLMAASKQQPNLKFIEPGNAADSYLYRKIINDPTIDGAPMPQDPINGYRPLGTQELADIETWINNGAMND